MGPPRRMGRPEDAARGTASAAANSRRVYLDYLLLDRVLHQLSLVVDVELTHEVEFVRFHGFDTQVEGAGDFFDGVAFRQQFEDFFFALRERGETWQALRGL